MRTARWNSGRAEVVHDRYTERFTFAPDDDGNYWLRCAGCTDPVGSDFWGSDRADLMLSPLGDQYLRELAAAHDRQIHPDEVPAMPAITPDEMLTPAAWCIRYGLHLHSRDGWRGSNPRPWMDPITLPEFTRRAKRCTQDLGAWQHFVDTVLEPKSPPAKDREG
jgi:hypothetical protein